MASMNQPTLTSPLPLFTRQRVTLFLCLIVGLIASIALVAVQFQSSVTTVTTPPQVAVPVAPDGTGTIVGAYEALQNQRLAAVQALQAGNTEAYEIAVSGAQALQSRIASVQMGKPVISDRERSIVDLHDQVSVQRLAAMQALQAGDTEGYEIAMLGADALQSRITSLQAGQPALTDRERTIVEVYEHLQVQHLAAVQALRDGNTEAFEIAISGADALRSRIASLQAQP